MCALAPLLYAGGAVALGYSQKYAQMQSVKNEQRQMDAQAKIAVTDMNYKNQNLEQQRLDAFDEAVAKIDNIRLNSLQLNSGVKAAVNETMNGRTGDLIVRSAEGDTARAVSSVQDNYRRESNEVALNKAANAMTAKSYLESLNAQASRTPSRLHNFLQFGANVFNIISSENPIGAFLDISLGNIGVKTNFTDAANMFGGSSNKGKSFKGYESNGGSKTKNSSNGQYDLFNTWQAQFKDRINSNYYGKGVKK